jgi:hypothetical protein
MITQISFTTPPVSERYFDKRSRGSELVEHDFKDPSIHQAKIIEFKLREDDPAHAESLVQKSIIKGQSGEN